MFGRRRRQRETALEPDAITALVEAESPETLTAVYRTHPVLATDVALDRIALLREAAWQLREFALILAYQWCVEFLLKAKDTGPEVAAEELFNRIAWLDRRIGLVFLATAVPAVEHLILTTYPYPLRGNSEAVQVAGKRDLAERLRTLPAEQAVPLRDDCGTPIPDEQRWRIAAMLAWDMGASAEANEIELVGAVVLSTIGLALAPEGEQVAKLRELRANVALRCRQNHEDDTGALDWAIFTAEEQLRTQPPEVVGMNTMYNLRLLLRQRNHGPDARRADEFSERMAEGLTWLGNQKLVEFLRSRQVAHADEAIGAYEHALNLLPPTSPERAGALANIANGCRECYDLTRDDTDITRAVEVGEQAAAMFEPGDEFRPGVLSNLCLAYLARFIREARVPDIDAAIEWGQAAVDATLPDDPDRAKFLSNLAQAHVHRLAGNISDYELEVLFLEARHEIEAARAGGRLKEARQLERGLGRWGARPGRRHNLDRAVELYAEAIAVARPDDPDRAAYLTNQATLLETQAAWSDGEVPVEVARASVDRLVDGLNALDANDPRRSGIAYNLGSKLGDDSLLQHAATLVTGPPHIRLRAAQKWGDSALTKQDLHTAVEAYGLAVEMLERIAWRGRDRDRQEAEIGARPGFACNAAALAVRAGRPERAVELLERGRSLMWGQLLHLRSDLTRLAEADPALAASLDEIRTRLDRPLDTPLTPGERLAALDEWEDLLARARAQPGFERFLHPLEFAELRFVIDGPVAVVNISRFGCHALIVTGEPRVRVVKLAVTAAETAQRAERVRDIVSSRRRTSLEREANRREFLDVLEWLWTDIAEPVLTELGHTEVPDGDPPRMWWCPTGPLTALPLHAAGRHTRTNARPTDLAQTAAGRVVSSYTPTLTALTGPDPPPRPADCLVVGVASAPGLPPLPAVGVELDLLRDRLPAATYLVDADATSARVRTAITAHSWVHLACHAGQDQDDPVNSAFAMWDKPLTVAELIGARTPGGALAYLAACQTATGAAELADEALHLAGTVQMVGYRQVIATLWTVIDQFACEVSAAVYGALTPGDPCPQAARALHAAIESMRARHPADPFHWAAFLHTGR